MQRPTIRNLFVAFAAAAVLAIVCNAVQAQNPRRPGQRLGRSPDRLKQGDAAPDFTLKTLDGKATVQLSSFRGKKPVALVFGSYT